jgi:hypothetical protein
MSLPSGLAVGDDEFGDGVGSDDQRLTIWWRSPLMVAKKVSTVVAIAAPAQNRAGVAEDEAAPVRPELGGEALGVAVVGNGEHGR